MSAPVELSAEGPRVGVRTVRRDDVEPYRRAVEASSRRLSRWNPVDPDDIVGHLERQSDAHRTFLVLARDAEGSHGVVGRVNLTNVVRGRFRSGVVGYDAFDPYVGRGLFREGLRLVVDVALRPVSRGGAGLHRVEANVQPANVVSAGLLRSLGFRHEGSTPRMLWLGGRDGEDDEERWRDHERFAVTTEEWPAQPYAPSTRHRRMVLVSGLPGSGATALARALARELVLPFLPQLPSLPSETAAAALWQVLATCPDGAVVDGSWPPGAWPDVAAGLAGAGVAPASVVHVSCGGADGEVAALGPVLRVDTSRPLGVRAVTDLALRARALST